MTRNEDVLRRVDDGARRLARSLVRAARHGAMATLMPEGSIPLASRVLVSCDDCGNPLLLVSQLSTHSGNLAAHPRCSMLFGEPADGDPLASPRISVFGEADVLNAEDRQAARERFLARHPSAEIYCDFADFRFLRLSVSGASLVGGFARAYELARSDFIDDPQPEFQERLVRAVAHMNEDHREAVGTIAAAHCQADGAGWRIVTADSRGFEMTNGARLVRAEFGRRLESVEDIRPAFVDLVRSA